MVTVFTIFLAIAVFLIAYCAVILAYDIVTTKNMDENKKEAICNAVRSSHYDWMYCGRDGEEFCDYFERNFDKYL